MRPRWILGVAASITLAALAATVAPAAGASVTGKGVDQPLGSARRVLIFSVPTLSWSEVRDQRLPNIERVLGRSAVAALSVRTISRRTSPTDGYATLNAGTRARGSAAAQLAFVAAAGRSSRSGPDGDPQDPPHQVFESEPPTGDPALGVFSDPANDSPPAAAPVAPGLEGPAGYRPSAITREFARRTGVEPREGEVFNFGLVPMIQANAALYYDAEVGAFGSALAKAGVHRAVIANGDHPEGADVVAYRREATVGLMDDHGLVDRGRVGKSLLQPDTNAPFATRYDIDAVTDSFRGFWRDRSVVLVEASDLVRYEDFKSVASADQQKVLSRSALARSDELLGKLLAHVDLRKDAVVLIAPWAHDSTNSLTVLGVAAPGVRPGLLSSGTTRRAGFVQTVDVAPSVLSLVGVAPPTSMEGTQIERDGTGGDFHARVAMLDDANAAAQFRDDMIGPVSTFFVVAQLLLWLLAALAISGRSTPRLRFVLEVVALALLVFLPATFAAGAFPFYNWGSGAYWAFVVVAPLAVALVIHRAARANFVDPVLVGVAVIVGFISVDVVVGAPLQFNTVFGYTPTVAGRFAGLGNPAFSMITAAVLLLAGLVAYRLGGRRGTVLALALLVWVLLLDGLPFWGADVGGALTLVPTLAVVASLLTGVRLRLRTILYGLVGAVAVTVGFGLLDLTRPPERRSHLGRLLADIGNSGPEALRTVIIRKLLANLAVVLGSVWTLMVPVAFVFLAYVIWRAPGRMQRIAATIPQERAIAVGLIVAMLLGFALNDSGISVPGLMLGVANAALVFLLVRVNDNGVEAPAGRGQPDPSGVSQSRRSQMPRSDPHEVVST